MERRRAPPRQFSLGVLAGQPVTDRLFFAVLPDARAADQVVELARSLRARHGLRGNPLPAERVHVTLHHLGDHAGLPESLIAAASEAAARVATPPFDACFDCVASFPGRARKRPCVLRSGKDDSNPGLFALQAELGERLRAAGLGRHIERRFTPHVTLLYDESRLAPEPVPPIAWRVREFVLVHSLIGRSEHRVLGRWSLRD
ncbi:MAG TPA: RNA 2',3'-cyclic phosphodiesterase [Rhodanobacteraceae bacterium]|jgi:2'-5' RNA ligase|nr:RNA 2',3'-cyclic phosphodiesterase [Rhodanobacteraceae bacterium]